MSFCHVSTDVFWCVVPPREIHRPSAQFSRCWCISVTKYLDKYPYKICYLISISVTKYLDKSQYKICYVDVSWCVCVSRLSWWVVALYELYKNQLVIYDSYQSHPRRYTIYIKQNGICMIRNFLPSVLYDDDLLHRK